MHDKEYILNFCDKIRTGKVKLYYDSQEYLEYVDYKNNDITLDYIEYFDDDYDIIRFIEETFELCHDLISQGKYCDAMEILDEITDINIVVNEYDCGILEMNYNDLIEKRVLSLNITQIFEDYILACNGSYSSVEELAANIAVVIENLMFKEKDISAYIGKTISQKPLSFITLVEHKLKKDLIKYKNDLREELSDNIFYTDRYTENEKIRRIETVITMISSAASHKR